MNRFHQAHAKIARAKSSVARCQSHTPSQSATETRLFRYCLATCWILASAVVLVWNEEDLVVSSSTVDLVHGAAVVSDCTPHAHHNDKLVFLPGCKVDAPDLSGRLPTILRELLHTFHGSHVAWEMELRQWTQEAYPGFHPTAPTYTCKLEWVAQWIDSSTFECGHAVNDGHTFPTNLARVGSSKASPFTVSLSRHIDAMHMNMSMHSFVLDEDLQQQLPEQNLVPLCKTGGSPHTTWERQGGNLTADMLFANGRYLQTGAQVGDIRIRIVGRTSKTVTVAARQHLRKNEIAGDASLGPLSLKTISFGKKTQAFEKLLPGSLSLESFMWALKFQIYVRIWLIRMLCLVVVFISVLCVLTCLATDARSSGVASSRVFSLAYLSSQKYIACVAGFASLSFCCGCIALSWITVQPAPVIGIFFCTTVLLAAATKRVATRNSAREIRIEHFMLTQGVVVESNHTSSERSAEYSAFLE